MRNVPQRAGEIVADGVTGVAAIAEGGTGPIEIAADAIEIGARPVRRVTAPQAIVVRVKTRLSRRGVMFLQPPRLP